MQGSSPQSVSACSLAAKTMSRRYLKACPCNSILPKSKCLASEQLNHRGLPYPWGAVIASQRTSAVTVIVARQTMNSDLSSRLESWPHANVKEPLTEGSLKSETGEKGRSCTGVEASIPRDKRRVRARAQPHNRCSSVCAVNATLVSNGEPISTSLRARRRKARRLRMRRWIRVSISLAMIFYAHLVPRLASLSEIRRDCEYFLGLWFAP